ncbi:MAG: hypothetical protein WC637_02450 [Victivallales bacterium]|jgi:hypothetical protein
MKKRISFGLCKSFSNTIAKQTLGEPGNADRLVGSFFRTGKLAPGISSFLTLTVLMLVLSSDTLIAAGMTGNLRYMKTVPSGKESDILKIVLDSDLYDSVSANFADIRLTDGKNAETPFIVRQDTVNETQISDVYQPAKIISLTRLDDNRIYICVEIPGDIRGITGLVLKTPSKNFEKQADVYGSSNMKAWKTISEDQNIFDYSEVIALSNTTLRFSGQDFKYYNISIANFAENIKSPRSELITEKRQGGDFSQIEKMTINTEVLKIDEIGFLTSSEKKIVRKNKILEYPVSEFSCKDGKDETEILLSTKKEPLTLFTLETESNNFSRSVSVDGSNDGKDWRNLTGCEKITKIDISGYRETDLKIAIPESRFKHYRIKVSNGNAPPVKFSAVRASGNIYCLELINPKTSGGLSLYYGGTNIPLPAYDIREILDKLKNPSYSEVNPGERKENPSYKPGTAARTFLDSKMLFTSIIALMVLILGWILYKGFRKIDTMNPE